MTLMELTVALAILGLASLAFSNVGPWLAQARMSAAESNFWRAVSPTHLLLADLAAGAIDPETRTVDAHNARFRALAPRLKSTPITIELAITQQDGRHVLRFNAPELGAEASVLMETDAPLRFATDQNDALIVERERAGAWAPIIAVPFAANAPFVCAFDPIPRTCRS